MSYTAIRDVEETLITLLRNNMADLVTPPQIALVSPAQQAQGQDIRLSLFLYSIIENQYLKNSENRVLDPTQTAIKPIYVDLYYLLTSYTSDRINEPTERTLHARELLGRAMRVFYDNGILSGAALQGGLANTTQELRLTLTPITVEDLTRIWSVFPNNAYQPSVSYLITPVQIDSARTESRQRVIEKELNYDFMVRKPES
jgi:hypothetical protein